VPFTKEELEAAFEEKKDRYVRANRLIKETLDALLNDLSKRYGVRDGLIVLGEPKKFVSFHKKATEKYECETIEDAFEQVRDLSRVRVLCPTLSDCDRLVQMLQEQNHLFVDPVKIERQIENQSETGYRAIHLEARVDVPVGIDTVGVPVEVQIRTILQEAWGFYTHGDFYKGTPVTPVIANLMREFSTLLYWADRHAVLLVDEVARVRAESAGNGNDGENAAA
jgi:ppGpp synthetase/RelA/SpoT-type nucleotidyltranferase